jgi:putative transposase
MTTGDDHRRGRHLVSALHVQLVLVTKYRRGVLTGKHTRYLAEVFRNVRRDFSATLVACNGQDDHVHPLAGYPPKVAIASLVNSRTGVPARKIRQRHQIRTHREHLWSPSYLAASCVDAPLSTTKQ